MLLAVVVWLLCGCDVVGVAVVVVGVGYAGVGGVICRGENMRCKLSLE